MIKFVYCIRKQAGLSDEEFHTFWRDVHGPFIRSLAQTLQAKKYIQSHTLNTPINAEIAKSRGLNTAIYDGVTEIWWESMDDFLAAVSTPEGQAAAQQYITDPTVGEVNFVDFSQSCAFLTEEHTVFDFS
ncbi:EthD domain-containing protein [Oculatella sp. FACHB-28]|uniref:EthD domain-containing protein n=1 Tax=Cyanophyceae TaxID=3028117 RepID=UPI001689A15F|nr:MULTISPECIES: EthD domain-containing protein [Cyanophyceae]MBD1998199.1 EthD domain-containing protein [Leptolyngbya sp. FACHB-541]MBD2057139.1 EthD domain-containing protein [Oculatella sp. FACHB-28]